MVAFRSARPARGNLGMENPRCGTCRARALSFWKKWQPSRYSVAAVAQWEASVLTHAEARMVPEFRGGTLSAENFSVDKRPNTTGCPALQEPHPPPQDHLQQSGRNRPDSPPASPPAAPFATNAPPTGGFLSRCPSY